MSKEDKVNSSEWLHLSEDETVIYATHPSLWSIFSQVVAGLFLIAIGAYIYTSLSNQIWVIEVIPYVRQVIGGLLVLSGIVGIVVAEIHRRYRWYVVTSNEIYSKRGIISHDSKTAEISNIQDRRQVKSLFQRILGFGDVEITTAGTSGYEFVLYSVPEPNKMFSEIDKLEASDSSESSV